MKCFTLPPSLLHISHPLSQSIDELAINFFFAKYTFNAPPFPGDYRDWLTQSYHELEHHPLVQAAIQAVGMAGISNVLHAPEVAHQSGLQYRKVLSSLKQALYDPVQSIKDTTLVTVILLGLFETVNLDTWDRYLSWAAHVKGAMALLELRGQQQFDSDLGAQLYVQVRSQILFVCTRQHLAVPPALVEITYNFETSAIHQQWQTHSVASPGSFSEISFRMVNLRAAFKSGEIADSRFIHASAVEIDSDLDRWRAGVPSDWKYTTFDASEAVGVASFDAKCHVYPNIWIAEAWNSWRTLRILVNQIIVQNEALLEIPEPLQKSISISVIQQLSTEICISTSSFEDTPCAISLINPMYVVLREKRNESYVRSFAIEQLHRIDTSMGIRQAGLLAKTGSKRWSE